MGHMTFLNYFYYVLFIFIIHCAHAYPRKGRQQNTIDLRRTKYV